MDETVAPRVTSTPTVGWVLASLAPGMFLASLGTSSANIALPTLAESFAAPFQQVQWVVLAYLLATTTTIVGAGRLGDIAGRRRLLLAGISLFTVASAVAGGAPGLGLLIAARGAQGIGAAVMMALTMAFASEAVPKARIGTAMGWLGTMSAVGTALGPSLGGVLIATLGWRAIFLVNVPLGATALILAHVNLPAEHRSPTPDQHGVDALGTVLLVVTLAAYALAMTIGRGRFGLVNVALLVAAALGGGLFIWAEARASSPLIELTTLRDPGLRASLAMNALVSTVMMATLVVGPFYLARALGLDTPVVGVVMSVGPVIAALTGVPAGRVVDRFGADRMTVLALTGLATGCGSLAAAPARLGIAGYVIPIALVTAAYALFQAANNTAVMADVSSSQRGVVAGMLNLSRSLGLVTGASVMGAIFAGASGAANITTAGSEAVAIGMRVTLVVAAALMLVALATAFGKATSRARRRLRRRLTRPYNPLIPKPDSADRVL